MEKKIPKGELTRKSIVDTARKIFNEKGVNLTLDNLAREMDMPKGRITNHFATKDKLFLAILDEYEAKLVDLRNETKDIYSGNTLSDVIRLLGIVMDVQYEYRCAILFLAVLSPGQVELKERIQTGKKQNAAIVKLRLSNMVEKGLVDPSALDENEFERFIFMYLNTMTQWVVYLDMYDIQREYKNVKHIYISGIINHVYGPFLTTKAKKQLEKIDIRELIKPSKKK